MGNKNGIITAGIVGLGGLAAILILTRGAAAGQGNIVIEILDENGNPIPPSNSFDLEEGGNYQVRLTVTNTSMKGETPWEATLTVGLTVVIGGTTYVSASSPENFSAGQERQFTYPFTLELGTGGLSGPIDASVKDPNGVTLGSASDTIHVIEVPIVYGADIVIG